MFGLSIRHPRRVARGTRPRVDQTVTGTKWGGELASCHSPHALGRSHPTRSCQSSRWAAYLHAVSGTNNVWDVMSFTVLGRWHRTQLLQNDTILLQFWDDTLYDDPIKHSEPSFQFNQSIRFTPILTRRLFFAPIMLPGTAVTKSKAYNSPQSWLDMIHSNYNSVGGIHSDLRYP